MASGVSTYLQYEPCQEGYSDRHKYIARRRYSYDDGAADILGLGCTNNDGVKGRCITTWLGL